MFGVELWPQQIKPHLVCLEPLNGDLVEYVDLDLHPEHDGQMFC